jgi:uncharacterized membrane protein YdbT with pleckstrin-like domain
LAGDEAGSKRREVVSYIESSLGQNEALHYRARFHWIYHAMAWGALIIGVLLAMLTVSAGGGWLSLVFIIAGVAIWLSILVPIWTTEIGVTNQRIIYKRGMLERETNELQLRSIEEIRFNQDVLGRIFDYGKLEIHGTGDDAIFLPALADPIALRAALQDAVGAAQGETQPVNGNGARNGNHAAALGAGSA